MKKRLFPLLAILALVASFVGFKWWTQWRFEEVTDDAYVEGEITNLAPKISGLVAEVAAGDNQLIKKGDILVRIDDRDQKARLAEAQALAAGRAAQLAQIDDKVAVQEALLVQAGAGISAARADLTRSRADLERTRALVREEFVSRQRFDTQKAEAAKAEASVRGSNAQADVARRQLAVLDGERAVAQAQLDQAKAQVALAESDLDATIIRAPLDGTVGNRVVRVGQYVRPGQHLLSVVPTHDIWIDANYKETQLGRIKLGATAHIKVDAFPGQPIEGKVASFSPASGAKFSLLPPENATGNFTKIVQRVPVRIELPDGHPLAGKLAPGMSVVVTVRTGG